jgi:hypothetical protein
VSLERDEGREEESYLVNLFALFVLILPSFTAGERSAGGEAVTGPLNRKG